MNRLDNHQPLSTHPIYFAKVDTIAQTFVSHRPNLNIVSICMRNPSRLLTPLKFELLADKAEVVRSLDFTGGNIDNFDCTKFQFDPVLDSNDKNYTARITAILDPTLDSKEKEAAKSGLYVESHGGGDYLGGNAFVDGKDTGFDLHFKTLYRQEYGEVFKESYLGFGSRIIKDPIFFVVFLAILTFVIIKIRKAK